MMVDGYIFYMKYTEKKICASALIKVGITLKDGLVPAPLVTKAMGFEDWGKRVPEWITAWIEAEGKRPWPSDTQIN
jgi:hypothetical protein